MRSILLIVLSISYAFSQNSIDNERLNYQTTIDGLTYQIDRNIDGKQRVFRSGDNILKMVHFYVVYSISDVEDRSQYNRNLLASMIDKKLELISKFVFDEFYGLEDEGWVVDSIDGCEETSDNGLNKFIEGRVSGAKSCYVFLRSTIDRELSRHPNYIPKSGY